MSKSVAPRKSVAVQKELDELFPPAGVAVELRLISVDDVQEVFKVATLIHCHFTNAAVIRPDPSAEDEFIRDPHYNNGLNYIPELTLINVVDQQWENNEITIRINRRTGVIWSTLKNTFDVNESLELFSFPWDRQLFRVGFKSPNASLHQWQEDVDVLDLDPIMKNGKVVGDNDSAYYCSCELNSWHMVDLRVSLDSSDPDPVSLCSSEFELTIMAERDPVYYLNNYVVVMFFIVLVNILNMTLSVDKNMGDRVAASVTLLLAAVAFKFVLANSLPKVSYSTWSDVYIRVAFVTLFLGAAENFVVSPKVWCTAEYFGKDVSGTDINDPTGDFNTCIVDSTVAANRFDILFHAGYALFWFVFNVLAAFLSYVPSLVRPSWDHVIDNQIGDTEATVSRTNVVHDVTEEEDMV